MMMKIGYGNPTLQTNIEVEKPTFLISCGKPTMLKAIYLFLTFLLSLKGL